MPIRPNDFHVAGQVAIVVVIAIVGSACGNSRGTTPPGMASASAQATSVAGGGPSSSEVALAALIAGAKQEGTLTTIALNRAWCNYGDVIESFKAKYGLDVNELDPDATSAEEVEAIRANRDNRGPLAPDVIDIAMAFGPAAKKDGLIVPYKVATWDSIPTAAKDAEGYWYGDYYGVLAFEVNKSVVTDVPQDWADLLDPAHRDQVGLPGDPRVNKQAIQTVYAAALARGGSLDDAQPGLDFFKKLSEAGNLVPTVASQGTIDAGTTPITIRWSYHALKHQQEAAGSPDIAVTVPTTGRFGGVYVQAISAFAPHPNAARLWMEFLYGDEGQNLLLDGFCHPIRFDDLLSRNMIPAEVLAKLPDTAGTVFPTIEQLDKATRLISDRWDAIVGVDIR